MQKQRPQRDALDRRLAEDKCLDVQAERQVLAIAFMDRKHELIDSLEPELFADTACLLVLRELKWMNSAGIPFEEAATARWFGRQDVRQRFAEKGYKSPRGEIAVIVGDYVTSENFAYYLRVLWIERLRRYLRTIGLELLNRNMDHVDDPLATLDWLQQQTLGASQARRHIEK